MSEHRREFKGPASVSEAGESEISLSDILTQLLARKWWIIGATLLGTVIGGGIGQLPANMFEAHSLVQIERRSGPQLPSELVGDIFRGGERDSGLATEVHIIRSRLVLEPVIQSLSLDVTATAEKAPVIGEFLARRSLPVLDRFIPESYARAGESLRLARFELPDSVVPHSAKLTVLDGGEVHVSFPDGREIRGASAEPIPLPGGGTIEISALNAPAGRVYHLSRAPIRNVVSSLSANLNIRERGATGIVDFRYSGMDREQTVRIINTVVSAYQDQNLRRRAAEIDQSIDFIEEQLPELRTELRTTSAALADYRQSQGGRELSISTQELLAQTVTLETEIENIAFRREQLLQSLTPNHPDYRALEIEQERLRARLDDLRARLSDVPEAEQELARLTQQVERARLLELQLVNRVEQLRILRASTVGNIFVLEPAEVGRHIGPDRRNPIAIGAALGFILSALGIFGLNAMRRGIEDAREIEELGLSLFATVNKSPGLIGIKPSDPRYGMAICNPRDIVVEALRGLRTGLRFSLAASQSKSLMITSCAPGDGKSFISLNLAVVSGQTGSRVLLIDCDMRRGFLRQYFGLSRDTLGLSDILSGSENINQAIHRFDDVGIDFMPTGIYPPNPAELLASPSFDHMLSELSPHYDLLILDAPPVLAVADPGIIGQSAGMSLLVVKHLTTSKTEIQSAQKTLANAGINLSGSVLNQFDMKAGRYGAYGTRYGNYYGGYNYKYENR